MTDTEPMSHKYISRSVGFLTVGLLLATLVSVGPVLADDDRSKRQKAVQVPAATVPFNGFSSNDGNDDRRGNGGSGIPVSIPAAVVPSRDAPAPVSQPAARTNQARPASGASAVSAPGNTAPGATVPVTGAGSLAPAAAPPSESVYQTTATASVPASAKSTNPFLALGDQLKLFNGYGQNGFNRTATATLYGLGGLIVLVGLLAFAAPPRAGRQVSTYLGKLNPARSS